jgi:hypothetical protein
LIKAIHSGKAGSSMNPGSPGSFLHPLYLTHGKSEASQHTCPFPLRNKSGPNFTASGKVTDRRLKVQGYINEAVLFVF